MLLTKALFFTYIFIAIIGMMLGDSKPNDHVWSRLHLGNHSVSKTGLRYPPAPEPEPEPTTCTTTTTTTAATTQSDHTPEHPCAVATRNITVNAPGGKKIICLVPSTEELLEQMRTIGGFNRRYMAVTWKEAEKNFVNLIHEPFANGSAAAPWWKPGQLMKMMNMRNGQQKQKPSVTPPPRRYSYKINRGKQKGKGRGRGKKLRLKSWKRSMKMEAGEGKQPVDGSSGRRVKRQAVQMQMCLAAGRRTAKGLHFCPVCQKFTRLPQNVFPRYINELTCNAMQSSSVASPFCGFGRCFQSHMYTDLLVRDPTNYKLVFQNSTVTVYRVLFRMQAQRIGNCCECVVTLFR